MITQSLVHKAQVKAHPNAKIRPKHEKYASSNHNNNILAHCITIKLLKFYQ